MSDACAATDAELLASLRAFVEQHRNGGDAPANVMRVMTLLHRLLDDNAADAARIRELEAAGRALLTCPAIADIASEDRDPEDVVAERKMRAALGSRRDG